MPKTINRPQTESITKPKFERTLVAVMVLLFIVLTFWAAMAGIRGTDQYWYLADSQSLISGHGVHTNVIYPISARFAKPDYPLPFIHNILNIYLAAGFGFLAGAYWGWILLNLVSSLLTAFLIYKILRRYADERLSLMVSSMYLLIPLTFWQTTQLLAEASITPLVALGAYLFLNTDRKFSRWLLLMTVVGLLLISRASFLPLIPLVPLAFLLCNRPLKAIHVVQALVLLVVGTVFYFIMKYVLVQNAPVEMTKILTTGTQSNLSNMALYFDISKHSPQISEILHTFITKLIRNLMVQIVPRSFTNLLMFIPFNLLVLLSVISLLKKRDAKVNPVHWLVIVIVALHVLVITVMQNQFRYMLPSIPVLLVGCGVLLAQVQPKKMRSIWIAASIVCLMANGAISMFVRTDGHKCSRDAAQTVAATNRTIASQDAVMLEYNNAEELMVQYCLRPSPVLTVIDSYGTEDYLVMIRNMGIKWLICKPTSPILDRLGPIEAHSTAELPRHLVLYRLDLSN